MLSQNRHKDKTRRLRGEILEQHESMMELCLSAPLGSTADHMILYKIARIANYARVLSSGNPKRIARHYANKAIGRYVVGRMCLR